VFLSPLAPLGEVAFTPSFVCRSLKRGVKPKDLNISGMKFRQLQVGVGEAFLRMAFPLQMKQSFKTWRARANKAVPWNERPLVRVRRGRGRGGGERGYQRGRNLDLWRVEICSWF